LSTAPVSLNVPAVNPAISMSFFAPDLANPLGGLSRLSNTVTRSICPENPTGEKGGGARAEPDGDKHPSRELGRGWKCRPFIIIKTGETAELAGISGSGMIQHIWMTPNCPAWRHLILRVYWEGQQQPSIECPVGDFFACGWGNRENFAPVVSAPVCVNPGSAFNCYWPMPFRKACRVTLENRGHVDAQLYYQIDYALGDVPEDCAYFHAQFRRVDPLPEKQEYTILDGVRGRGHYVGTYMCWGTHNDGWWGEGEIKFFLDGDQEFPTICGTGTEDYFCGSFNFENLREKRYQEFNTPYAGMPQVLRPDGLYRSQMRFSLYRWHLLDPIRFTEDLRVTIQALGWRSEHRFFPRRDDLASVAFWYQTLPAAAFPPLPERNALEIV
jgi:hypothetical protein